MFYSSSMFSSSIVVQFHWIILGHICHIKIDVIYFHPRNDKTQY